MNKRLKYFIFPCAMIPVSIAIVTLLLWEKNLTYFLQTEIMQPETAVAMIIAGCALFFSIRSKKVTIIISLLLLIYIAYVLYFHTVNQINYLPYIFNKTTATISYEENFCFILIAISLILSQNKKINFFVFNLISLAGGMIFLITLTVFIIHLLQVNHPSFLQDIDHRIGMCSASSFMLYAIGIYLNLFNLRKRKKNLPLLPSISIISFFILTLIIMLLWLVNAVVTNPTMQLFELKYLYFTQVVILIMGILISIVIAFFINFLASYFFLSKRKNYIMDVMGEGLIEVNINGYIVRVNHVAESLLLKGSGLKLQNHHIFEILHPKIKDKKKAWANSTLYEKIRNNQVFDIEYGRVWGLGGGHFNSMLTAVPFKENNFVSEFTLIFRDFTKKEQQLYNDTLQLDAILNNVTDAIITIDTKGCAKSFNKAAEKIFGYAAEEVIGNNIKMLMANNHYAKHDDYLKRYLQTGKKHIVGQKRETLAKHKNGYVFPMEISVAEYQVAGETFFSGIVRDLTGEKSRLKQIKMLTYFSDSSRQGFVMLDEHLNIIYCNPYFLEVTSCFQDDKAKRIKLSDCYVQKNIEKIKEIITTKDFSQYGWSGEIIIKGKKEEIPTLHNIFCILSNEIDACVGMVITDITQQKIVEKKLANAIKEADLANKAKSSFLARMSHEIRTPINGIFGAIELLSDTQLDYEQNDLVNTLSYSCDNLLSVINDILDFSKLESGNIELRLRENDVHTLIYDTISFLNPMALKKRINLSLYISPNISRKLIFDAERLKQILFNIVGNAIKFTFTTDNFQGNIEVYVETVPAKEDGIITIQFQIKDNGIGMDEQIKTCLFKPFSQAQEAGNREYTGTGLGLAICKLLVDSMNGEIMFLSERDIGTKFTVTISVKSIEKKSIQLESLKKNILLVFQETPIPHALNRYLDDYQCKVFYHYCYQSVKNKILALEKENISIDFIMFENFLSYDALIDIVDSLKSLKFYKQIKFIFFGIKKPPQDRENIFSLSLYPLAIEALLHLLMNQPIQRKSPNKIESVVKKHDSSIKLLLAEDNEVNQKIIIKQLDKLGYACDIATDGLSALLLWRKNKYLLMLMDCHMPKMDGFELTKIIREEEMKNNLNPTLIIGVTANVFVERNNMCLQAGMTDYLVKPFRLEALNQMLNKYIKQPSHSFHQTILLDGQAISDYCCNDLDFYLQALNEYLAQLKQAVSKLHIALQQTNFLEISELAHKMKASSQLIGLNEIFTQMEKLEKHAKLKDREEIKKIILYLDQVLPSVERCITQFLLNHR